MGQVTYLNGVVMPDEDPTSDEDGDGSSGEEENGDED